MAHGVIIEQLDKAQIPQLSIFNVHQINIWENIHKFATFANV